MTWDAAEAVLHALRLNGSGVGTIARVCLLQV